MARSSSLSLHSLSSIHELEELSLLVASAIGLYFIAGFTYRHFIRAGKNLRARYGSYAIVTGATDGIGKAIAMRLAERCGMNLILVSRTESKLKEVANEITQAYPKVQVDTVAIDFSAIDDQSVEKLRQLVKQYEVGVLINNVGLSYAYPEWYEPSPCRAPLWLSAASLQMSCEWE
jgi:17beta-estradiol 17-dehydrogenase / very-long-chain 3-oxoacyl-CoA reductase